MYRILIRAPGFDADLSVEARSCHWVAFCPTKKCVDVVFDNIFPEFFGLLVEARFELAFGNGLDSRMGPPISLNTLACNGRISGSLL